MYNSPLRQCVCVVLADVNYKFLMVTRSDGSGVGLPGGKVEDGETLQQAARRELWEETGVYVDENALLPVYEGFCTDARPSAERFYVTTFLAFGWSGVCEQKETDVVPKWLPFEDLLNNSPFGEYNAQVAHGIIKKFPHYTKHIQFTPKTIK